MTGKKIAKAKAKRHGRVCSVCTHPKHNDVEKDLLGGMSGAKVSSKYGIPLRNLRRHIANMHLAKKIAKARDARDVWDAKKTWRDIERIRRRELKYEAALDEALADPERPGQYFLGARATDIEVGYYEEVETEKGTKLVPRKALLSELLQKVPPIFSVRIHHADPRALFLKALEVTRGQLELIGRLQGQIKEAPINIFLSTQWMEIKAIILGATKDAPDVRTRIVAGLKKIAGDRPG